jgi:hypothetical protein
MNEKIANDLIRYAELVEDAALISPEEMNCASLMRLAAEALAQPEQSCPECVFGVCHCKPLAQPEQEHVAWLDVEGNGIPVPVYTAQPQRKPLTDEQIRQVMRSLGWTGEVPSDIEFARAIEAAHGIKEKNT